MRLLKQVTQPQLGYQIESLDPQWVTGPRSCRDHLCPFKNNWDCMQAVVYWKGPELERRPLRGQHFNALLNPNFYHPCMELIVPNRHIYTRNTGTVHWCWAPFSPGGPGGPVGVGCTNYAHEHVRVHNSFFWGIRRNPWARHPTLPPYNV
jgi:hypothetical protein